MHIFEMEVGVGVGGYRPWERMVSSKQITTTNNHIISTKLFIFCATFTIIIFNLNFFTIHVHLTLIIVLLTIAEFWTVKSSSDRAAFIYLFIYLFIYSFIYLFICTGLKHICSVLFAKSRQVRFLFQLKTW